MYKFFISVLRRIFPFITERINITSDKNPSLAIQQDGVWGTHVSSRDAFQSGDYPEGMWRATFRMVSLKKIKPSSILVLGSGAGSSFFIVQQILKKEHLSCELVGVEWDPVMTRLGRLLYGDTFCKKNKKLLAGNIASDCSTNIEKYHAGNITVVHEEAGRFLKNSYEKYSMIIIDLFHCFEVIPLVFESAFIERTYDHLERQGHIIINAYNTADTLAPLWGRAHKKIKKIFFRKNTLLWIQ